MQQHLYCEALKGTIAHHICNNTKQLNKCWKSKVQYKVQSEVWPHRHYFEQQGKWLISRDKRQHAKNDIHDWVRANNCIQRKGAYKYRVLFTRGWALVGFFYAHN
jgi:hypothetical protein